MVSGPLMKAPKKKRGPPKGFVQYPDVFTYIDDKLEMNEPCMLDDIRKYVLSKLEFNGQCMRGTTRETMKTYLEYMRKEGLVKVFHIGKNRKIMVYLRYPRK